MDWTQMVTQSKISYGLPSKDILIYGSNNLGKGKQMFKLAHKNRKGKKGVVFPFEAKGTSAKADINMINFINSYPSWKNFVKDMYRSMTNLYANENKLLEEQGKLDDLKLDLKHTKDKKVKESIKKRMKISEDRIKSLQEKIDNNDYKNFYFFCYFYK